MTEHGYVLEMLRRLHPPPYEVVTGAPHGGVPSHELLALPSLRHPRVLLSATPRRTAVAVLRRQLPGSTWRARVVRAAAACAVATGIVGHVTAARVAVVAHPGARSAVDVLAEHLGEKHLHLAMRVGPARANRKPVLQLTGPHGRTVAYVKVGHDELTRTLVRHESAALSKLRPLGSERLVVPDVLGLVEWAGLVMLLVSPLDVPRRRGDGAAPGPELLAVAREIALSKGVVRTSWQHNSYLSRLRTSIVACGERGRPLVAQLDALDAVRPDLDLGVWHGDLNPGNLAVARGVATVWDWERYEEDVPVGFDVLHHELSSAITVRGGAPASAARALLEGAPHLLRGWGLTEVAASATARLYLLTLAARYLTDRQDEAGSALGRVEEWILPALVGSGVDGPGGGQR